MSTPEINGGGDAPDGKTMIRPDFLPIGTYDMSTQVAGQAVIINNRQFHRSSGLADRIGTDTDAANLFARFNELGFMVRMLNNLTGRQIESESKQCAASMTVDNVGSAFVMAILTHGDKDVVIGVDGYNVEISDILSYFMADKCDVLAGKPKLFFIQACQGKKLQDAVEVADAGTIQPPEFRQEIIKIPAHADFLVAYSTVTGYYSFRNQAEGSWFIHALSDVLKKYGAGGYEIMELLTYVNYVVSKDFEAKTSNVHFKGKKQIPCVHTMLRKRLFLGKQPQKQLRQQ